MQSNNISLDVLTHGKPVAQYTHEGKTFIESRENSEYSLRIKNHNSHRVKVVISVDSLNVISGKPASNDPQETGYILGPNEEQTIKGYRVDGDTVAQFKFVKRDKSYATEKGEGAGNGVIAVRAYAEKQDQVQTLLDAWREAAKNHPKEKEYIYVDRPYPVYPRPWYWETHWYKGTTFPTLPTFGDTWCSASNTLGVPTTSNTVFGATAQCTTEMNLMNCSLTSHVADSAQVKIEPQSFDMGSAWGQAVKDVVTEVKFEVGGLLAEVAFYYASLESLKLMGVNVERVKAVTFPEPFKREYCAKPSGWKG